jgi:hypothetical protein
LDEWGWQTWIALPLVVEARSVGLIEVVDHQTDERWSPHDIAFCQTIASQAAMAVRSAQLHEGMRRQVLHDQLTGLLSHRGLHEQLEASLVAANAGGGELSVVAFDLDGFRAVNDRDGAAGDPCRVPTCKRSRATATSPRASAETSSRWCCPGGSDGPAITTASLSDGGAHRRIAVRRRSAGAEGELDARALIDRAQSAGTGAEARRRPPEHHSGDRASTLRSTPVEVIRSAARLMRPCGPASSARAP